MSAAEYPDVTAYPLERALEMVRHSGKTAEVVKIYPSKSAKGSGQWRVVRQSASHETVILTAAEESEGVRV